MYIFHEERECICTMPFYADRLSKNSTKINISRNRVAIAIELIEEGSIACGQMITTLFFPPLPFIFQVCQFLMVMTWYCRLQITLFADFCFLNTLNILVGACLGLGSPCCDIPHHIFSQGIQAGRCLCVRGCGIKGKLNEQPHKWPFSAELWWNPEESDNFVVKPLVQIQTQMPLFFWVKTAR